ncbi:14217_t:CDS:1, partial [Acaulospora colombiana]
APSPPNTALQAQTTQVSPSILTGQSTQATTTIANHIMYHSTATFLSKNEENTRLDGQEGSGGHTRRRGSLPLATSLPATRKESVAKSGRSTPVRSAESESRRSHETNDENSSLPSGLTESANNSSECSTFASPSSTNAGTNTTRTKRGLKGTLSAAENYAASLFKTKGKGKSGRASPSPGINQSHKQEK